MMDSDTEEPSSSSSSDSQTPLLGNSDHRVILVAGHNLWEWAFLLLCIPNVIIILSSCSFMLADCVMERYLKDTSCVFQIDVCIICGIGLIFAVYGVFAEHQYDIYLHCVFTFFAIAFSYVSWAARQNLLNLVLNSCAAALWLICFLLGRKATTVLDWTEFRIIGVSDPLAAMYKQVCYFLAVLKFDSLFLIFVAGPTMNVLYGKSMNSFLLLGFVILYSILSWACGKAAVVKEDMPLSIAFIVLTAAYPTYVGYQCYELLIHVRGGRIFHYSLTAFSLFVVVTKFHLACQMKKTWQTFGYGLNTRPFQDLVTRDPSSLLAHSRSALIH